MTTHLRARALQAGALLVLVGGMLAVASAPAQAVGEPSVKITSLSATNVPSGDAVTLKYTVSNPLGALETSATITVSGMPCKGDGCTPAEEIPAGQSKDFSATLTAPKVDAGQNKPVQILVSATIGTKTGTDQRNVTVRGADKPDTVRQISGRVKDQGGEPLAAANVGIQDAAGHQYDSVTNDDGRYSFNSSDDKPIVVGTISIAAVKSGYKPASQRVNGGAGKTINVALVMVSTTASASPSPTPSVTPSPTPTVEATGDALGGDATDDASPPALDNAAKKDDSGGSLLFIILGGLLVAAGVGAIVLVIMRRRSSGDDPDGLDGGAAPNGGVPPSGGRYQGIPDATRVAAPIGARGNDATMITNLAGAVSLADQPTILQRAVPVEDEFPDPYGAPSVQPHGGYAGAGGYGTAAAVAPPIAAGYGAADNPFGTATQYGAAPPQPPVNGGYADNGYGAAAANPYAPAAAADPYAAYGAPANAYGAPANAYGGEEPQRFDEPTGMYRPQDNGGYGQEPGYDQRGYRPEPEYPPAAPVGARARPESTGVYQPGVYQPGGDYAQEPEQGGYGGWNAPAGGIDDGNNAYAPPAADGYGSAGGSPYGAPAPGSPYGAPAAPAGGGYSAPADIGAGYGDQVGYDPRGGYDRPESYDRGQQPPGGYDAAPPPAGGYGAVQQPAGGYGGQPQGGYVQPDGYGMQGGYDDAAGYGGNGQTANGQADPNGYYGAEQVGGRHGGPSRQQPPESTHPGQRRPLDWLDD